MSNRKRKRGKKSLEGLWRARLGDIRHALECCKAGLLTEKAIPFLEGIVSGLDAYPKGKVLAAAIGLT
jgi:hypothetical protein